MLLDAGQGSESKAPAARQNRKRFLTFVVVVVVAVVVIVGLFAVALSQGGVAGCTSTWSCAAGYPIQNAGAYGVAAEQCVTNSTYLFCVGGLDAIGEPRSEVYSAAIVPTGNITSWTQNANSYPDTISGESCITSSGYIYCVGGSYDAGGDDVASSYYAQLLGGGKVGMWFYTTPYPVPTDSQSCVTLASYIYCVGGNNETDGTENTVGPSSSNWYAPLSETGIGTWKQTTTYPTNAYLPSCFIAGSYIYCVGGVDSGDNPIGNAYYASLSSSGVGQWVQTTSYLLPSTGPSCAASRGYVYCVGGATTGGQTPSYSNAVYMAPVSSAGIGTWTAGPNFPIGVATSCAIGGGRMYCVGGFDGSSKGENNAVVYASLSSL